MPGLPWGFFSSSLSESLNKYPFVSQSTWNLHLQMHFIAPSPILSKPGYGQADGHTLSPTFSEGASCLQALDLLLRLPASG